MRGKINSAMHYIRLAKSELREISMYDVPDRKKWEELQDGLSNALSVLEFFSIQLVDGAQHDDSPAPSVILELGEPVKH